MIRTLITMVAQKIKGPAYSIDPQLPISAALGFAFRRLFALFRCLVFGVKYSADFRRLVFVGPSVTLRNSKLITFGNGVTLGQNVLIDGLSKQGVKIGNNVNIGPYTQIEATGVITSIGEGCTIGESSGIGAFSYIGAAGGVNIGRDVIMGQRVSFHSENHNFTDLTVPIRTQGVTRQGISIGNDCWVGANVVFLDGADVGSGCVVAAGAVVRGIFPPNMIIAGVPAKIVRSRDASSSV